MKNKKIDNLIKIQEIIFNRDSANFKSAQGAVEFIESEILELRNKLNEAPFDMGIDASELSYWSRHNIWIERRILALTQNLATARAIAEERKQQLSYSSGRIEVTKKINRQN